MVPDLPISVLLLAAAFVAFCFWLDRRSVSIPERIETERAESSDLDQEIRTYIKRCWREKQRARRAAA